MNGVQIVLITLLSVVEIVSLCSWFYRVGELDDNLWIEPTILAVVGLFIYLVAR